MRWLALALTPLAACARPRPTQPTVAALHGDLERLIDVQAAAGWDIDRLEVEELLSPALMSVCEVPPARRDELAAWLADAIATRGGPVDHAWRAAGRDRGAVAELVRLDRMAQVLDAAIRAAPADCPFWAEASDDFGGRQISRDRWQVSFGGGGKGIVVNRDGETDLNFGGAGRLLLGRTFGTEHGVYLGAEFGGTASFPREAGTDGERGALVLGIDLVTPLVYRRTFVNSYVEVEAGYLGQTTEEDLADWRHGLHLGAAIGARATRARLFFPGAAFGVGLERLPSEDTTVVKVGLRAALDWDL